MWFLPLLRGALKDKENNGNLGNYGSCCPHLIAR